MPKSRSGSTSGADAGESGGPSEGAAGSGGGGRTGGVKKQCEECGASSPVACRICERQNGEGLHSTHITMMMVSFSGTACGADFYSHDRAESPSDAALEATAEATSTGERRRSERVKREKPGRCGGNNKPFRRRPMPPLTIQVSFLQRLLRRPGV